jgi:biopolymer transport protein ExbD
LDFNAQRRRSPLILELTPLIDVVFLLLLFFMVSTTFVQEPAALEVDLPQSSSTALVPAGSDTEILLGADGRIVIGGKVTDLAALKVELRRIAQEDPNTQVVVRGDKTVPYQQLIDIMSLAQEEGLTQFSLATSRPVGGGETPPGSAP